ncbi:MAG: extracellular solute-binding protein [Ruminococcus sp.]|jgi:ABC-type glycerol-3-phosphate transport system substrate-binding protein|nr:extracellular solute-binding protein [Ruminococcus sp.]
MKKIFAILTALIILSLTACKTDVPVASKEYIFSAAPFMEDFGKYGSMSRMVWTGSALIFTASKTDVPEDPEDYDNYVYHSYIVSADKNGQVIKEIELPTGSEENGYASTNYTGFSALGDGTVLAVLQETKLIESTDGYLMPDTKTILASFDENLVSTELLDLTEILSEIVPDNYLYIESFTADEYGNILIHTNQSVYGIDIETGNVFFTKSPTDGGYIGGVIKMPDGRAGVIERKLTDSGSRNVINPIDPDTGTAALSQEFPVYGMVTAGAADSEYDYYSISDAFIYGLNADSEIVTVADMLSSAMGNLSINAGLMTDTVLVNVSSTEFIISAMDSDTMRKGLYLLTKVAPESVPDKELISVAGIDQDYNFTDFVKRFNDTNMNYQVNYKMYFSADASYSDRITEMNTDILAGNVPDILLLSSDMPYGSYIKKGLLADLYPYLDKDEELSREDLVESALKAFETDGKLLSVAPTFMISSLAGKTSTFGEKPGLTLSELQAAAAKFPDAKLFRSYTQSNFMQSFVYYSMDEYVDFSKGECYFDSPGFIEILNAAKDFPAEIDYANYDYRGEEAKLAKDEVLLEFIDMRGFRDIISYGENGIFGTETTFLGFPNSDGESGIAMRTYSELAMMTAAKNPDGAWEFIKGYINYPGPPPQPNVITSGNGFFLSKKLNDNLALEATQDQFYYDDNGTRHDYQNSIFVAGQVINAPNNTDADNQIVYNLIDSISTVSRTDTHIWEIITEDTENFFSGKKSAEETAAMIQNRVSTYLAESA